MCSRLSSPYPGIDERWLFLEFARDLCIITSNSNSMDSSFLKENTGVDSLKNIFIKKDDKELIAIDCVAPISRY